MSRGRRRIAATRQRSVYEGAYRPSRGDYGFPDRKIADGKTLLGKRILSIGCGAGRDVWWLVPGNSVTGLDYAGAGLRVARRHGIRCVARDLNADPRLPFRSGSFDLVVAKDILEHLLDPLAVAREIRRVLKPGGRAVLSVPNHFYWRMRLGLLFGRDLIVRMRLADHGRDFDEWDYMHIRFFTYAGFRRFLREAGLAPEKWFWDFGNLAHYFNPDAWFEPQLWKREHGVRLSPRARFGLAVLLPAWRLLNVVFPRAVRGAIVSLAPGLLCAGFYVRVRRGGG